MAENYQWMMQEIANLRRQMAEMFQVGTVHEVAGDKLRMQIGITKEGTPVLSPWLNTSNHRGGATEARFYKKGQTLSVICPGGDIAQGMITPYAPNKDFKRPDHANEHSDGEETYQLDDFRQRKTKNGTDSWVGGKKSADVKSRLNKSGGITHRVGTKVRVAAHEKGAKLRVDRDFVVVQKNRIWFSKPPRIRPNDPVPNDDD